ncbi:MAG: aminoacyl-tRNA hydrolase [Nitrospirales bacterium]|nr:aminoacyl-tRNA hydrolase [Nitrospirales bacterium]
MEGTSIPEHELQLKASRSGGPGGQHVNKVNSRVTLQFSIPCSSSLSDEQKHRLVSRLRSRVTHDGVLTLHCQLHRSQLANRRELLKRFATILAQALEKRAVRKKTRIPRGVSQHRLEEKRQRGFVKHGRQKSRRFEE